MKKFTIAALTLISITTNCRAWYFAENPDKYPSVALGFSNLHLSGDRAEVDQGLPAALSGRVQRGDGRVDSNRLKVNLRLPATESVTIDVNYAYIDGESVSNKEFLRTSQNLDGYEVGADVRLYLNR